MSVSEVAIALDWLFARLAGIAAGGVHAGVAPPGQTTPYITVNPYGGDADRMNMSGVRLWSSDNWLIEAWGPDTNYAAVAAVAAALDTALHKQSGTAPGGTILSCIRTADRFGAQLVGGAQWLHQGGIYATNVQAS